MTFWTISGCSNQEVITPQPEIIEVPGPVQWREIPPDLLVIHNKSTIPETLTWSEVAQLWTADRETIDILLGNLLAINSLGDPDGDIEDSGD